MSKSVAGALLGIVSHLVGKNQIDKSCNENLGELKDHPYAKERIDYLTSLNILLKQAIKDLSQDLGDKFCNNLVM